MTAVSGPRAPPVFLDWRDSAHWSGTERPCRYCGRLTHLRDGKRKPAHKVCAETALARQAAEQANAYHNEGNLG